MAKIEGVAGADLAFVWPKIAGMVEEATNKTETAKYYGINDIFGLLVTREMQLWLCTSKRQIKAFAITQIIKYPKKQVFDIFLVGGTDVDEWVHELWQTLKDYGKEKGCDVIRSFGRKGWIRILPDDIKYTGAWTLEISNVS